MTNDYGMTKIRINDLTWRSPSSLAHFSRIGRAHLCCRYKRDADGDQEKGKELASREIAYQLCIGLTEVFDRDPKHRVQNKKQPGQYPIRLAGPRADEPQDREQNNPFEKCFVELRGMPRCQNRAQ